MPTIMTIVYLFMGEKLVLTFVTPNINLEITDLLDCFCVYVFFSRQVAPSKSCIASRLLQN